MSGPRLKGKTIAHVERVRLPDNVGQRISAIFEITMSDGTVWSPRVYETETGAYLVELVCIRGSR